MMDILGVGNPELLRALGIGLILVTLLIAAKITFRLTRQLVRAGCIGILVITLAAYSIARFLGA